MDEGTNHAPVTINGSGFVAAPNAQHIHGSDEGSTCPIRDELDDDDDGDGFTSSPEAHPPRPDRGLVDHRGWHAINGT